MKSFPAKVRVKSAIQSSTPMDLSYDVYTTTDFFRMKPIMVREMVPKDKFTVDVESFVRLSPLAVPTFGRMKLHFKAFFVPCRTIMQGFNEFKARTPFSTDNGKVMLFKVVTVANNTLANWFKTNSTVAGNGQKPDFLMFQSSTSAPTGFVFSEKARIFYDICLSCKMEINFADNDVTPLSAMKLLSFYKAYLDFYFPTAFVEDERISSLFMSTGSTLSAQDLDLLADNLFACYETDYFTSVWQNPVGPNVTTGFEDNISLPDATFINENGQTSAYVNRIDSLGNFFSGTPYISASRSTSGNPTVQLTNLTQYALNALRSLTNYMQRNRISGYRPLERFLTRYGVRLSDAETNRSTFIGASDVDVQISDVTSTADTEGAALGDYAGKGVGYGGSKKFHYETDEFGYFIVIMTLIPHTGYFQGRCRELQHISPLDFFTPEFDNLGVQAVRNDELFSCFTNESQYDNSQSTGGRPDGIFGYAPRYSEYKYSTDLVTGDFRLNSRNTGLDSYHLLRDFGKDMVNDAGEVLNLEFNQAFVTGTNAEFDRVFSNTLSTFDHFTMICHVQFTAIRPMQSIVDSIPLDGGRDVTIGYNGTQFN